MSRFQTELTVACPCIYTESHVTGNQSECVVYLWLPRQKVMTHVTSSSRPITVHHLIT